jgi:hypothetical protein
MSAGRGVQLGVADPGAVRAPQILDAYAGGTEVEDGVLPGDRRIVDHHVVLRRASDRDATDVRERMRLHRAFSDHQQDVPTASSGRVGNVDHGSARYHTALTQFAVLTTGL